MKTDRRIAPARLRRADEAITLLFLISSTVITLDTRRAHHGRVPSYKNLSCCRISAPCSPFPSRLLAVFADDGEAEIVQIGGRPTHAKTSSYPTLLLNLLSIT